jgi:hypothetical protein
LDEEKGDVAINFLIHWFLIEIFELDCFYHLFLLVSQPSPPIHLKEGR